MVTTKGPDKAADRLETTFNRFWHWKTVNHTSYTGIFFHFHKTLNS